MHFGIFFVLFYSDLLQIFFQADLQHSKFILQSIVGVINGYMWGGG